MSSFPKTGLLGDRSAVVFCALLGITVAAVLAVRLRGEAPATPQSVVVP